MSCLHGDKDNHGQEEDTKVGGIPMRNHDGSVMFNNNNGRPVYRSQYLSTHPLKSDCKERIAPGNVKLTYVTGEGVIRTMNEVFGHEGWSTEITMERVVQCERDDKGRWVVGYLATVRVTLLNGTSHEDCGCGEETNESKIKAHDKAFKSAVTDAMKRAARHFGERLGNALYVKGSGIRSAPVSNAQALSELEQKESRYFFGDQDKSRKTASQEEETNAGSPLSSTNQNRAPSHDQQENIPPRVPLGHNRNSSVSPSTGQPSTHANSPQQEGIPPRVSLGPSDAPRDSRIPSSAGQMAPPYADTRTDPTGVSANIVTPSARSNPNQFIFASQAYGLPGAQQQQQQHSSSPSRRALGGGTSRGALTRNSPTHYGGTSPSKRPRTQVNPYK